MIDAADVRSMHVPPDTRHVAAIRSFVGAVGRAAGCSQETIEDLRLAATEACAQALEQAAAPDGIDLRIRHEEGRLLVEIAPVGAADPRPDDEAEGIGRWALIRALFPDAERLVRGDEGVLRFTVATDQPDPSGSRR